MNGFRYYKAQSAQDAVAQLGSDFRSVKLLAGGLDLLGELKQHLIEPETVVSISGIPELSGIEAGGANVEIGAVVKLREIAHSDVIRGRFTALAEAASQVGSPQIRHMGTLGGNLCQRPRCWYYRDEAYPCLKKGGNMCYSVAGRNQYHAILGGGPCFMVHPSDCAPALAALGATVRVLGPDGEREMPLGDFYVPPSRNFTRENVLSPGEILTHVILRDEGMRSTFVKFRERESYDWALASVAVAMRLNNSRCEDARIVLGGVAPIPWRARAAEDVLRGAEIAEAAADAARVAVEGASPLTENAAKIPIVRTLIERAVMKFSPGAARVEASLIY